MSALCSFWSSLRYNTLVSSLNTAVQNYPRYQTLLIGDRSFFQLREKPSRAQHHDLPAAVERHRRGDHRHSVEAPRRTDPILFSRLRRSPEYIQRLELVTVPASFDQHRRATRTRNCYSSFDQHRRATRTRNCYSSFDQHRRATRARNCYLSFDQHRRATRTRNCYSSFDQHRLTTRTRNCYSSFDQHRRATRTRNCYSSFDQHRRATRTRNCYSSVDQHRRATRTRNCYSSFDQHRRATRTRNCYSSWSAQTGDSNPSLNSREATRIPTESICEYSFPHAPNQVFVCYF